MFRTDYSRGQNSASVTDGLSNTIQIGEVLPRYDRWTSWAYSNNTYATCAIPLNIISDDGDFDPLWWPNVMSFRSAHVGGAYFGLADGSVHWLSDTVELRLYRALATIQGTESVSFPN